jgi:hypothetical protein
LQPRLQRGEDGFAGGGAGFTIFSVVCPR